MKCNKYAIYGWKSKKSMIGGTVPSRIMGSIPALVDSDWLKKHLFAFPDRVELCEGEIESQIELEYIPYYGGSDANIEVRFRCKKCGYQYAGDNGLPYDVDSLNKYLTEIIKERN